MKKESLDNFLNNLTNRELAFFSKFRQTEFMPESQEKIHSELPRRNITGAQIEHLTTQEKQGSSENCPRCQSTRFFEIQENELRNIGYSGYEVEVKSRRCQICGYNPHKDKPLS